MRLLHTSTIELHEFSSNNIPKYAILSHTWGNDEFLFSDFQKEQSARPEGYDKVSRCCELAASEGWQYVWIDTCCIDKSSSSELNESINSMYRWYKDSAICYVYLADFSLNCPPFSDALQKSRWFRRGWTLQELLAPDNLVFFDKQWVEIGSKTFLEERLSQICNISKSHLEDPTSGSIAARMSWASRRETSREEDLAYSLLGLFNIHMPLIYGEGANAFRRLQLEIIASSDDESIFAWRDPELVQSGLLARHPAAFEGSGDILSLKFQALRRSPYHMSNKGLSIDLKSSNQDEENVMLCPLNCARSAERHFPIVLFLQTHSHGQVTSRVNPGAVENSSGGHNWTDLKDVHLFIAERNKIRSNSKDPTKETNRWLPTAIRLVPSLLTSEHRIWVDGIDSDGSFAGLSGCSPLTSGVSSILPHAANVAVSISSLRGLEAVLWWQLWNYHKDPKWCLPRGNILIYSAAGEEELVIKAANLNHSIAERVFCRHVRSGVLRTPEPTLLGAKGNASIVRSDGTFLWLRTRQECVCDDRRYQNGWRMVIDISVTTFDHSKI